MTAVSASMTPCHASILGHLSSIKSRLALEWLNVEVDYFCQPLRPTTAIPTIAFARSNTIGSDRLRALRPPSLWVDMTVRLDLAHFIDRELCVIMGPDMEALLVMRSGGRVLWISTEL